MISEHCILIQLRSSYCLRTEKQENLEVDLDAKPQGKFQILENLEDPTSIGEENENFFIRVWKSLPSRHVLKTLKESPKGKAQRGPDIGGFGLWAVTEFKEPFPTPIMKIKQWGIRSGVGRVCFGPKVTLSRM